MLEAGDYFQMKDLRTEVAMHLSNAIYRIFKSNPAESLAMLVEVIFKIYTTSTSTRLGLRGIVIAWARAHDQYFVSRTKMAASRGEPCNPPSIVSSVQDADDTTSDVMPSVEEACDVGTTLIPLPRRLNPAAQRKCLDCNTVHTRRQTIRLLKLAVRVRVAGPVAQL